MRVVSKQESDAHYSATIRGGVIGGSIGLALGVAGVVGASKRYASFRSLTLPFRVFLVTSSGTFGAITVAERYSIDFAKRQDPMNFYKDESTRLLEEARQQAGQLQRFKDWGRENRYGIVFASWLASMGVAIAAVNKNKYLTAAQKLVQARVYAQYLTLAVLIATAIFETADAKSGKGRWQTVLVVDPNDPEHKHLIEKRIHKEEYEGQDLWMDMVAAEEKRLNDQKKAREAAAAAAAKEAQSDKKEKAESGKTEPSKTSKAEAVSA